MASTWILFWLLLKPSTMRLTASPLMPLMACQKVILLAGSVCLGGTAAAWPPPLGAPGTHAALMSAMALRRPSKRCMSRKAPSLPFDGAGRQSANELPLANQKQHQRGQHDQ